MRRTIMLVFWLNSVAAGAAASELTPEREEYLKNHRCPAFKEYVTARNFLEDRKEFHLDAQQVQTLAMKIAQGCDGAASRFIKVTELLVKSQLNTSEALKIGAEYAQAKDEASEAFDAIFKAAYLGSHLDLDVLAAAKLAQSLSLQFKGNLKLAKDDFKRLAYFCVTDSGLAMPRVDCGTFAAEVAQAAERTEDQSAATAFEELYHFLTKDDEGPGLPLFEALKVGREVVTASPHATDNFIDAYKFAVAKSGLNLKRDAAVNFARDIGRYTAKPGA